MKNLEQACILITGIMASGKSTVAQRIAEMIPNSVHLRGDVFRKMIVNGRAEIESPLSENAIGQLKLRYQIAAQTADQYCQAGFTVVYQDVIIGELLSDVLAMHSPEWTLYVVVLCPSPQVALERDSTRHKQVYGSWTPEELHHSLLTETPKIGLWVDTSSLTVEDTVNTIFNRLDDAKFSINQKFKGK